MNAKELRVGNLVRKEYYDTSEKTYEKIYTVRHETSTSWTLFNA